MAKQISKRRQKRETLPETVKTGLELKPIKALTQNQQIVFDSWWSGKNLWLHGTAGTGKSFLALYLALQSVLVDETHDKVIIVRSVVPSRDMGFLPGNAKEKAAVYKAPYHTICAELFGRGDAYNILEQKNKVEFMTTSFARGTTLPNQIIVVDETQNMTSQELNTIFTRIGKNSRFIFAGDIRQTDLNKGREMSGIADFMEIIRIMKSFDMTEFKPEDIVRSALVKEYIMARNKLEDRGAISPLSRG